MKKKNENARIPAQSMTGHGDMYRKTKITQQKEVMQKPK